MLISSAKLVRAKTPLTTENQGIPHTCPGMLAGPVPVLLRWVRSYILHTVHAAPVRPIFVPDPAESHRHSHHRRPDDTQPKLQRGHTGFVHFSYSFPFRDGCDDSDGVFDGIIFTVATVAIVAPLILRLLHKPKIPPAYRSVLHAVRSAWPCFRSSHDTRPAVCRT